MRLRSCLAMLLITFALRSPADAATLLVNGSGLLSGATGVNVGGTLYDVEFVEGTCAALFAGCDSISDFTFSTETDALAASQALLDQVLLDTAQGNFDSDNTLTFGCPNPTFCFAITPFGFDGPLVRIGIANNEPFSGFDNAFSTTIPPDADSSEASGDVYARWALAETPIPEPATLALLGLGLAGMAARRWRQRKRRKSLRS